MKSSFRSPNAGFTLVELTIVIGIIGLVLGGIMGGRHLIHASELNAIIEESRLYAAAHQQFFDKYQAHPGDMADATRYFGRHANMDWSSAYCLNISITDNRVDVGGTCNGDGDGKVSSDAAGDIQKQVMETMNWPQHLAMAGFISGTYDGYATWMNGWVPKLNVAGSRREGGMWTVGYINLIGRTAFGFNTHELQHALNFSKNPFGMTPEEAWAIDKKIDDGKPTTGKFMVGSGGPAVGAQVNCALKANGTPNPLHTDVDAIYNLGYKGNACNGGWLLGY